MKEAIDRIDSPKERATKRKLKPLFEKYEVMDPKTFISEFKSSQEFHDHFFNNELEPARDNIFRSNPSRWADVEMNGFFVGKSHLSTRYGQQWVKKVFLEKQQMENNENYSDYQKSVQRITRVLNNGVEAIKIDHEIGKIKDGAELRVRLEGFMSDIENSFRFKKTDVPLEFDISVFGITHQLNVEPPRKIQLKSLDSVKLYDEIRVGVEFENADWI